MLRFIVILVMCLLPAAMPAVAQQSDTPSGPAASAHPLQPLDTSSPRDTLLGFLANGDAVGRFYRDAYHDRPTLTNLRRMVLMRLRAAERVLDLSQTPPAIRDRVALDASVHLYEVLSRIDLPQAGEIPGPDAVDGGQAPARWVVPHTDITLVRVAEGPRRGDYLFSATTVDRAADLYDLAKNLPYRRTVPVGNFVELRQVLGGFLIPPRAVEAMPAWARSSLLGLVVWKWLALALLALLSAGLLVLAWASAARGRRRFEGRPVATALLRLLFPVALVVVSVLATAIANIVINVAEVLGAAMRIGAEVVIHVIGAWIAWVVAVSFAEIVIASPRVAEGTLDAQLLRLFSRLMGLVAAVTLILIGGEDVGLPLVGLVAGVGIGGLAIALAAQDTLRNILGSLMIFFDKPYRSGDRIVVLGHDGVVEQIGLRSTRIRLVDGRLAAIPNEKMASAEVVNVSQRPSIHRVMKLGLAYDTPPALVDRALEIVGEVLAGHADNWGDRPPRVYFEDFASDGLTLVAHTWYHPPAYWEYAAAQDRINIEILRRFGEEGIAFATPTTVLEPGAAPIAVALSAPPA